MNWRVLEEFFWDRGCVCCAMVGQRWGTEQERVAANQWGGFYLSALPTPSPAPTFIHLLLPSYMHSSFSAYYIFDISTTIARKSLSTYVYISGTHGVSF